MNALEAALAYARRGYLVFPCKPGSKEPATRHGFLDASADPATVESMFRFNPTGFNVGLATGRQPNGINLLAIDVDAKNGGIGTWNELVAGHEAEVASVPRHTTPNGGFHVFFDYPPELDAPQGRLVPGIDLRGQGGYVVVPPSELPAGKYFAHGQGVARVAPPSMNGLAETLWPPDRPLRAPESDATASARARHPSNGLGAPETPAEWVRWNLDWWTYLAKHGWTHDRGEYWVRPGKDPRDGHSAQLHEGGPLVVWTTDVPAELGTSSNVDGSISVSLFDFIAAYEFGGDRRACASWVRTTMMAPPGAESRRSPAEQTDELTPVDNMNLPVGFWQARPILAHICQAAQARLVSPDAVLVNVLARSAAKIPPSLKLPPGVGMPATFDFLGCVVAETSGGKSAASAVGALLVVDEQLLMEPVDRTIMFDRPVGSGEGIAQAFMVPERDSETGKLTGRQKVGRQALHLVMDEATALIAQTQRKGTTIIQTLASAWSGSTLGQQNASAETQRIVDGGRCRVTAVLNMQSSNAWMLFTDEMTTLGLTGRLLFASAHDPAAPDECPEWPGPIEFEVPPSYELGGTMMSYVPSIVAEIRAERLAVVRGGVVDRATGHYTLMRCKVASILAVWEGRREVNLEDWALAQEIMGTSRIVLQHLENLRSRQAGRQRDRAAELRGISEAVAESAKTRRQISDLARRIESRTNHAGVGRRDLMRAMTAAKNRYLFDLALEKAIADGYVKLVDGRIYRV